MKLITKIATGTLLAGVCIYSNKVGASAAGLDTEIPSAGASVVLDDYCENSDSKEPEAEIVTIIEEALQAVKEEHSIFKDICIAKVEEDGYVNVRKKASTEAKVVGKIYGNCGAEVLKEKDGWYKIKSGNVRGWVKAEFFVEGEDAKEYAVDNGYVLATVNESGLRVRKKQSKKSDVISNIYLNETYAVSKYGKTENWIKLAIDEGVEGWVSTDYIDVKLGYETAITLEEEQAIIEAQLEAERLAAEQASIDASIAASQAEEEAQSIAESIANEQTTQYTYENNNLTTTYQQTTQQQTTQQQTYEEVSYDSGTGSSVVAYAKQFLGNPYVWGGSSLTSGTDCSGFTMSVYAHFGYSLPHQSGSQRSCGVGVSLDSVQPGDLICYSGHVAIYCGNGTIVHAKGAAYGICESSATYKTIVTIRRVL